MVARFWPISGKLQDEGYSPPRPMCLSTKCVWKQLDRKVPILLAFGDVKSNDGYECAAEPFGSYLSLQVVGIQDELFSLRIIKREDKSLLTN